MNDAVTTPDHKSTSDQRTNNIWSFLSCHFQPFILMSSKSQAEAFARSLHCKLRSLSQTAGDEAAADGNAEEVKTNDGSSELMTILKDVNGFRNSSKNDDDLGFCSPMSTDEPPTHSATAAAAARAEIEVEDLTLDVDGVLTPLVNSHNLVYEDIEESGCMSSVSSVLTEQDNMEVDLNYFEPIGGVQPRRFPELDDYDGNLFDNSEESLHFDFNHANPLAETESGFLPITKIYKQVNLEQGRGAINFENKSKVVDIEVCAVDSGGGGGDSSTCNSGVGTVQTTVADGVTLNRIIDEMLVSESERLEKELVKLSLTTSADQTSDNDVQNIQNDEEKVLDESRQNGAGGFGTAAGDDDDVCPVPADQSSRVGEGQNSPSSVIPVELGECDNDAKPLDDRPVRIRRSSSLKSCKTPPEPANNKKIVRFADALGLDLEDVKTVFLDDLPVVPSSAFKDLESSAYQDSDMYGNSPSSEAQNGFYDFGAASKKQLVPVFQQPGSLPDFFDRLRRQSVCLESAVVTDLTTVRLVIRVVNMDFNKTVIVRHTTSEWVTFGEAVAEYVENSNDVFSDKFYTVITSDRLQVGERLCLAIKYQTLGKQFWDNNGGQNYIFQCFPEVDRHLTPTDDSWIHFQ